MVANYPFFLCSLAFSFSHSTAFVPLVDYTKVSVTRTKPRHLAYKLSDQSSNGSDHSSLVTTKKNSGLLHDLSEQALVLSSSDSATEDFWSQEWHDSFLRNGLADFVPPLISNLNCMVVGDNMLHQGPQSFVSGDADGRSTIASQFDIFHNEILQKVLNDDGVADKGYNIVKSLEQSAALETFLGSNKVPDKDRWRSSDSDFDCILDLGLMNQLLSQDKDKLSVSLETGILLLEATRRTREHGVYIVTTDSEAMPPHVKAHLESIGEILGMEWLFDLDGISTNDMSVSVARRYFTGELPSVGRLARQFSRKQP